MVCDRLVTGLSQPFNQKVSFYLFALYHRTQLSVPRWGCAALLTSTICIWPVKILYDPTA